MANEVVNSMLIGRALSAASRRSPAALKILLSLVVFFTPRFSFLGKHGNPDTLEDEKGKVC